MKRLILILLLFPLTIGAQQHSHWRINGHTLEVLRGETYAYTTDTPEGEGLCSTLMSDEELRQSLKEAGAEGLYKRKKIVKAALNPTLDLENREITAGQSEDLRLSFSAGQRSPNTDIWIKFPPEVKMNLDNTLINVIGRGFTPLRLLQNQYMGRSGDAYSVSSVGSATLSTEKNGTTLHLQGIDLRPFNGTDIELIIKGLVIEKVGSYAVEAYYQVSEPSKQKSLRTKTSFEVKNRICNFRRNKLRRTPYNPNQDYTWATFLWNPPYDGSTTHLLASTDNGQNWEVMEKANFEDDEIQIYGLKPQTLYAFKLQIAGGRYEGDSNVEWYYSGEQNVRNDGMMGDDTDVTDALNRMIDRIYKQGGGVIFFPAGNYGVRTVHLKSNVWLRLDTGATIKSLPGADAPETTWFSDRGYRSGLSPKDLGPYLDADNYLTKQDVGHTYFHNSMFFAEREENIKIIGTGRITGNGNIVTSDKVMNNKPDKRCDKMFTFKLCKDIEIGGEFTSDDLWYDEEKASPYYITRKGRNYDDSHMLKIDQGGHFVLLATGSDNLFMHDTYFAKDSRQNVRDIYDFMACNRVKVSNIFSRVSSDDVVKLGSDCSLGFTRKSQDFLVRNIIGDTNCNLFQIGSETADDISHVYIDNIYVLGANKAGFSISVNDGGWVGDVQLNKELTGKVIGPSVMRRTLSPVFLSISNRGRTLGSKARMFSFMENGQERKELLITNISIGRIDNVSLDSLDIAEVYAGSSFRHDTNPVYDGTQGHSAMIIAGYKLPEDKDIEGGRDFVMPDACYERNISHVSLSHIRMMAKGGCQENPEKLLPPELGVGKYNVKDMGLLPAYGLWIRHADHVTIDDCHFNTEQSDTRKAVSN